MIITALAIAFLILLIFIAYFGKMSLLQKPAHPDDVFSEKCSICREKFHKSKLIERQIGDYKMLYFCKSCVEKLTEDVQSKLC